MLLILSLDHNVYEIKLAREDGTGGDVTDTVEGVAAAGLDDLLQLQTSVMNICERTRELSREHEHEYSGIPISRTSRGNLVREIGSSRNRRWHQITFNWPGIV